MSTLAAVLVRQHALPLEAVEQAMLRQSLFGGDLATNLLELGIIDEKTLLASTAATLDAPALECGRITDFDPSLMAACPPAQLLEQVFLPIGIASDRLIVATSAPLTSATVAELETRFGRPVATRAALEVRIRQALALALAQPLDDRLAKLLAQLDGENKVAAEHPVPTQSVSGESLAPKRSLPAGKISLAPMRREAKAHNQSRLGPFTAAMAEIELAAAKSPGNVISVWLDFTSQYFDYTAVFAVQGEIAAGKAARGPGTVGEAFARIGVPLDLAGALQRARASASWQLLSLEPRGLDRTLARDLGRPIGPVILLLPICIRQRVVLITYGDHGNSNVSLDLVGDVLALKPLVERHLERLLVERKRGGRSSLPPVHPSPAPRDRRLSALAQDVRAAAAARRASSDAPAVEPRLNEAGATEFSSPPEARPLPESVSTGLAGSQPMSTVDTGSIDDSWDLIQPVLNVGDTDAPRNTRAPSNHPDADQRDAVPPNSDWPGKGGTRPGVAPKLELVPESEEDPHSQPLAPPDSARDSLAAVPAGLAKEETQPSSAAEEKFHQELAANLEEYQELLERLKRGDMTAQEALVAKGESAAIFLTRALPGPVVTPSRAPRMDASTKASDAGPVLKAIVAMGAVARPYLIARTSDPDPKVRVWAIRLLGELTGRESALAVAERIVLDRDAEVRRASYLASQQLLRDPESAPALREALLHTAADRQAVITQRLAAIDAVADLRDSQAIPRLIELLADANPGTAAAAQQALTILARQDFGYDAKTWTSWWINNAGRDRIEWVIDALEHRLPAIRQAASEELRLISRLYVGNFDDDSTEARARIQKKYRDWWAAGGRSQSLPSKA
ncbi:MAG TPA: HEAT repeat domain-containing protein [Polyangiaceae bacterium]|nr:HEAT repeat domain-containing protein [Polyangiaceae bacterium]